jgi:hypothetical protein
MWQVIHNITKKMVGQTQRPWVRQNLSSFQCQTEKKRFVNSEIAQIFIKHNAATKVLTFPTTDIGHPSFSWHGYRHFHLKKGKVKQGFIYENAQKKVLENCNFCPGKSLKSPWFCSTKKCMNPVHAFATWKTIMKESIDSL